MSNVQHSGLTSTDLHVPKVHKDSHVDGTDDIQNATSGQKGLATAAQITQLDDAVLESDIRDQSFTNLLENGDFESWSAGTGVAPDGWTLGGAGAATARDVDAIINTYSAKITYGSASSHLSRMLTTAQYQSRTMSVGCWVKTSTASQARIFIRDDNNYTVSAYHTGGGNWEFLTATRTIHSAATYVQARSMVDIAGSAYFDGAILVEGSVCPAFSPKPLADVGVGVAEFVEDPSTQSFVNLLENGDFESWGAGVSNANPDGWLKSGTGTIDRDGTTKKFGNYAAKITYSTGVALYAHASDYARYKGRFVTVACWVYATVASQARIRISDGTTSIYSSYHTGGGGWELLTVTHNVSASATTLNAELSVNAAGSAYFDGVILVEGSVCPAFGPKPLEDDGIMLHNHTPSAANDKGVQGQICWDASYIYVCVATDTWERVAIASW